MKVPVFTVDHLEPGSSEAVDAAGWSVLIARLPEGYRAVINRCSHVAAALAGGRVRRGAIQCPKHGAMFDLGDGRCIGGAYQPLRTFAVSEADGMVVVDVPDGPPTVHDLPVPGL